MIRFGTIQDVHNFTMLDKKTQTFLLWDIPYFCNEICPLTWKEYLDIFYHNASFQHEVFDIHVGRHNNIDDDHKTLCLDKLLNRINQTTEFEATDMGYMNTLRISPKRKIEFEKINAIEFLNGGAFQFLRSQPFEIEYMDMARTLIQVRFTYENNKRISIIGDGKKSYQKGDRLYLDMIEQTISYLKSDKLT